MTYVSRQFKIIVLGFGIAPHLYSTSTAILYSTPTPETLGSEEADFSGAHISRQNQLLRSGEAKISLAKPKLPACSWI
jgi:hypothetical protein